MPLHYKIILIYFVLINVVSSAVCMYDKLAAIKGYSRTPEKTLFLLSAIGGSPFMYLTMRLIRHKTLHKRFMIGIPLIIVLQIFLILGIYYLTINLLMI